MNIHEARSAIAALRTRLTQITTADQEQEVRGIAIPVLDAVMSGVRPHIEPGHEVLDRLTDLISVETIMEGEGIRAVDVLLVADQLAVALGPPEPTQLWSPPSWMRP